MLSLLVHIVHFYSPLLYEIKSKQVLEGQFSSSISYVKDFNAHFVICAVFRGSIHFGPFWHQQDQLKFTFKSFSYYFYLQYNNDAAEIILADLVCVLFLEI